MAKPYVEDPLIRSMRVRTWFQAVSMASGKTPAQLEREFSERKDPSRTSRRSCIWEKYRRGEVVPRCGCRDSGRLNLVERVEEKYPNTLSWLVSPLWRLADEAPIGIGEVRAVYESLPSDISRLFIARHVEGVGIFWRRPTDAESTCHLLARSQRIDALVALLAMTREAEAIQDQGQHRAAVRATKHAITAVNSGSPLRNMASALSEYLQSRWTMVHYPSGEQHSDLPLFR